MATPIPDNQVVFTASELLAATGGTALGTLAQQVVGVTTDSRRVRPGQLFVALRGERFDAHRFLHEVSAAGAAVVLVQDERAVPAGVPALLVQDTTVALGALARFHRRRWGKPVVAITGSAGKTTTKELTAAALAGLGQRVLKTSGNLNNAIGVPMTLLQLQDAHDVAVIEAGTNARGEIAALAAIIEPDVAVVTEVAVAHTAGLGTVEDVAVEKTDLLRALRPSGVAIWNADNPALVAAVSTPATRTVCFGTGEGASLRLTARQVTAELVERCVFSDPEGAAHTAELRLFGHGPALDAAAALAVVVALHGSAAIDAATVAMNQVVPTAGRLCPVPTDDGLLLLDDTYNANPISTARSLQTAAALAAARGGRLIAVLADMKELGDESTAEHRRVGRLAVDLEAALLIGCGAEMAHACDAAMGAAARHRLPHPTRVVHVLDPLEAIPVVRAHHQPNDVILIKGSRSMAMERVVDSLAPKGAAA